MNIPSCITHLISTFLPYDERLVLRAVNQKFYQDLYGVAFEKFKLDRHSRMKQFQMLILNTRYVQRLTLDSCDFYIPYLPRVDLRVKILCVTGCTLSDWSFLLDFKHLQQLYLDKLSSGSLTDFLVQHPTFVNQVIPSVQKYLHDCVENMIVNTSSPLIRVIG